MKPAKEIQDRIDAVLRDERLSYKTANIQVNAPLALIQVMLQTELHTLQDVLQVPRTNIKKLRGE